MHQSVSSDSAKEAWISLPESLSFLILNPGSVLRMRMIDAIYDDIADQLLAKVLA